MSRGIPVINFGGNIRFTPRRRYVPTTEAEVLKLLDDHADGRIRVAGALHSWSPAVETRDVLVDLRHFDAVAVERTEKGEVWATVGGGCRIKHLLRKLHHRYSVSRSFFSAPLAWLGTSRVWYAQPASSLAYSSDG